VTSLRLYYETVEQVLPNKRKYIADSKKLGRRRFLFLDAKDLNLLNLTEPGNAESNKSESSKAESSRP
jgi:hypothetical protein